MRIFCLLVFFWASFFLAFSQKPTKTERILIQHVRLIDGTGSAARSGSLRIQGDKIVAIGDLKPLPGEKLIDGKWQVLAPGFIDTHSHHLGDVLRHPESISTANQGITSIVIGQDGDSYTMQEIKEKLQKKPVAVNVASYTGHTTLRLLAMGEKNGLRSAEPLEIDQMKVALKRELDQGSLGLSTGLEYENAFYSTREEVLALARVSATNHGRYISHIRSEDVTMADALDEIIQIGKKTGMPVQISHIKLGKKSDWGQAKRILSQLEQARANGVDITADVYPYTYWHSTLRVLFPGRDYTNLASAELAVDQLFDPAESFLVHFLPNPSYQGKTIQEIARIRQEKPAVTLMQLIAQADEFKQKNPSVGSVEAIVGKSMTEEDVRDFITWEDANICSDGNAGTHPRGYGAFTRVLGRYVNEHYPLEKAIQHMTSLAAAHVGIRGRGVLAVGAYADLVLLDPKMVLDHATIQNPHAVSSGITRVWVNGQEIYHELKSSANRPGKLLTRAHE
jgi:N-acyl-D-aspartate/D-glutamate deacylase